MVFRASKCDERTCSRTTRHTGHIFPEPLGIPGFVATLPGPWSLALLQLPQEIPPTSHIFSLLYYLEIFIFRPKFSIESHSPSQISPECFLLDINP